MNAREQHTQYSENTNVWARILGNNNVDLFSLHGNLMGKSYVNLLEDFVYLRIVGILENDDRISKNIYMYDMESIFLIKLMKLKYRRARNLTS